MQLVIVGFRSLIYFSPRDLTDIGEIGAGKILELITCSATAPGMMVKIALISNKTKFSSSLFIERCLILATPFQLSILSTALSTELNKYVLHLNSLQKKWISSTKCYKTTTTEHSSSNKADPN